MKTSSFKGKREKTYLADIPRRLFVYNVADGICDTQGWTRDTAELF